MKKYKFDSASTFDSPIGLITVYADDDAVTHIFMGEPEPHDAKQSATTKVAEKAILKYLNGKSKTLDFKIAFSGTDFQQKVWRAMQETPFGENTTYAELAIKAGSPKAVRAVGGAVGSNPVPLIIGCHRVLGSNGTLTGYSGGQGLPTKKLLLDLEKIKYKS
jgi:methylated-DNA-[protein]-cysteine S-methyltransferase